MKRESVRRLSALLPLLLYAAAICGGSSGPAPESIVALNLPDVLLHGAEFAVFGFLAARWVRGETRKAGSPRWSSSRRS